MHMMLKRCLLLFLLAALLRMHLLRRITLSCLQLLLQLSILKLSHKSLRIKLELRNLLLLGLLLWLIHHRLLLLLLRLLKPWLHASCLLLLLLLLSWIARTLL